MPPSGAHAFVGEGADERTRQYRARNAHLELLASFYDDGRVRLAGEDGRRFAGALFGGKAELLDLLTQERNDLLVRVTPTGRMQIELRGGPYDGEILNCESIV